MTYNPNIPAAGTKINQTYNQITTNFSQLNIIMAADHYEWDYSISGDRGLHKQTTFIGSAAAPAPVSGRGAIYGLTASSVCYPQWKRDGLAVVYPVVPMKAHCAFLTRGSNGVCTLNYSTNITSVTRSSLGVYDVVLLANTFPAAFTSYNILASIQGVGSSGAVAFVTLVSTGKTENGFTLNINNASGVLIDAVGITINFSVVSVP